MTMLSGDLEAHLFQLYNLGRHHYHHTDNNDHDKAAQIRHDAEVLMDYIISKVVGRVRFGLETFKLNASTTNPRLTTGESVAYM